MFEVTNLVSKRDTCQVKVDCSLPVSATYFSDNRNISLPCLWQQILIFSYKIIRHEDIVQLGLWWQNQMFQVLTLNLSLTPNQVVFVPKPNIKKWAVNTYPLLQKHTMTTLLLWLGWRSFYCSEKSQKQPLHFPFFKISTDNNQELVLPSGARLPVHNTPMSSFFYSHYIVLSAFIW